jgi:MFS superfamily sulfate permease-like transporter
MEIKKLIEDFKSNYRSDLKAGFIVFLITLPLCIGISKASGFPPVAGLYTSIISGLIVSFFAGAKLTIKGPAAGLIVIAFSAVNELGGGNNLLGYKYTLAVLFVSSIFQIILGFIRSSSFTQILPPSIIHGMLASIGIIIIIKQVPILLGSTISYKEIVESLVNLPSIIWNLNPEIAFVGIFSLLILALFPLLKNKNLQSVPAFIPVIIFSVLIGLYFHFNDKHHYLFGHVYDINPENVLVNLPKNILDGITYPNFDKILTLTSLKYIVLFCVIGSIESLLSAKAIDNITSKKSNTNLDRDLVSIGIGNMIASAIGGLPMISEIVRSKTSVDSGAKSYWSNFFHGLFLLIAILFLEPVIKLIPNASLAALLIITGYKLSSPKEFYATYKIGIEQLIIFIATILGCLFTDLLIGILIGIVVKVLLHLFMGVPFHSLYKTKIKVNHDEFNKINNILIKDAAIFTSFPAVRKIIEQITNRNTVIVDVKNVVVVDHTFLENINEYIHDSTKNGNREILIVGLDNHQHLSSHPLATSHSKDARYFNSISGKYTMTKRQKKLREIAQDNNLQFEPKKREHHRLKFGSYTIRSKENSLIKYFDNYLLDISDVYLIINESIQNDIRETTLITIYNLYGKFPKKPFSIGSSSDQNEIIEIINYLTEDSILIEMNPDRTIFFILTTDKVIKKEKIVFVLEKVEEFIGRNNKYII